MFCLKYSCPLSFIWDEKYQKNVTSIWNSNSVITRGVLKDVGMVKEKCIEMSFNP